MKIIYLHMIIQANWCTLQCIQSQMALLNVAYYDIVVKAFQFLVIDPIILFSDSLIVESLLELLDEESLRKDTTLP
ncbi:hypothetical protein VNO78_16246 [Psophocarpus tetragonolobus]|uniref:Uncharacterized protein n=1 Tax=Psophocarpus tetragonolobus TaxID=3891 RepID=A0AAN9XKM1_PSOTE